MKGFFIRTYNKTAAFPIVAIGSSAGGLKAFSDLLGALPPRPGMAFVLVPHLAPQYLLKADPRELEQLYSDILISVTSACSRPATLSNQRGANA